MTRLYESGCRGGELLPDIRGALLQVQGFAASGAGTPAGAMQPPSLRQAFSAIVRNEGIAALWKGNGATIVHRLPYSAINFWAYERLTVRIQ